MTAADGLPSPHSRMTGRQQQAVANLLRVQAAVSQFVAKHDEDRITVSRITQVLARCIQPREAAGSRGSDCVGCLRHFFGQSGLPCTTPHPFERYPPGAFDAAHPWVRRALQEFLYAASRGDNSRLRAFLDQGFEVDSADYGARRSAACIAPAPRRPAARMQAGTPVKPGSVKSGRHAGPCRPTMQTGALR